jgi:hypothetical protein
MSIEITDGMCLPAGQLSDDEALNEVIPPPFYRTRVDRAIALLEEAAKSDFEYQGDLLGEGVREGWIRAALCVLHELRHISEHGR